MIYKEMKVSELLDRYPGLLPVLAGYHPHFARLRNRVLRKLMAPRVTLEQAARMAGVDPGDLLMTLKKSIGEQIGAVGGNGKGGPIAFPWSSSPIPEELSGLESGRVVSLDVRPDLHRGEEPFARIMKAVKSLDPGQVLLLRVPFEPVPLYEVLRSRGLCAWAQAEAPEDWKVYFYPAPEQGFPPPAEDLETVSEPERQVGSEVTVDVRGLEPPEPMRRILEALNGLRAGQSLFVLHERRPMFLLPRLDERGFAYEIREEGPGKVTLRIRKRDS